MDMDHSCEELRGECQCPVLWCNQVSPCLTRHRLHMATVHRHGEYAVPVSSICLLSMLDETQPYYFAVHNTQLIKYVDIGGRAQMLIPAIK